MRPSEILDKAADIILRDGWIQGTYFRIPPYTPDPYVNPSHLDLEANRSAPCCQGGAISRAITGLAWDQRRAPAQAEAERRACWHMTEHVRRVHGVSSAIEWNDRDDTTAGMVVVALRGAASDAREAGE